MCQMDGLIWLDVNIDCEYLFLFVLCQNVMYYCTALSAIFDWICALQVFIIISIIKDQNGSCNYRFVVTVIFGWQSWTVVAFALVR